MSVLLRTASASSPEMEHIAVAAVSSPDKNNDSKKEGNVLFNDALYTFYLRLYGVGHMVKDHSHSEKGNPLPPHRLLYLIDDKGSFIRTIPQTG